MWTVSSFLVRLGKSAKNIIISGNPDEIRNGYFLDTSLGLLITLI